MRRRLHRLRDLVTYLIIAVGLVTAAGLFGIHQARTGGEPLLPMKWLGFAGLTGIVFGYAIHDSRAHWDDVRFRFVLGALFLVHLCVGVVLLLVLSSIPLLTFALLVPIEFFGLMKCLARRGDSVQLHGTSVRKSTHHRQGDRPHEVRDGVGVHGRSRVSAGGGHDGDVDSDGQRRG